jgi:hypothetical protein
MRTRLSTAAGKDRDRQGQRRRPGSSLGNTPACPGSTGACTGPPPSRFAVIAGRFTIRVPEADLRNFALRWRARVMPQETWPCRRTATWRAPERSPRNLPLMHAPVLAPDRYALSYPMLISCQGSHLTGRRPGSRSLRPPCPLRFRGSALCSLSQAAAETLALPQIDRSLESLRHPRPHLVTSSLRELAVAALAASRRGIAACQARRARFRQWLAGEVHLRGIRENASVLAVLEIPGLR